MSTSEEIGEDEGEGKIESLLSTLDPQQLKHVVMETAERRLEQVKNELQSKIMEKETSMMKNIEKLKV